MALVAFSPSSPAAHEDLQPFEQLAVKLSSCFSSLESDDADASLSQALEQVGRTFAVDECTLVSYDGAGSANVVGSWGLPPHPCCTNVDIARMPWLIQRLARNAVTAFTPATRLCHAASGDRDTEQRKELQHHSCRGKQREPSGQQRHGGKQRRHGERE